MAPYHRRFEHHGLYQVINGVLFDVLAVVACKDYDDYHQAQGQARVKAAGLYNGPKSGSVE